LLQTADITLDGEDLAVWNMPNESWDFMLKTTYSDLLVFLSKSSRTFSLKTIKIINILFFFFTARIAYLFKCLAGAQNCFNITNWHDFVDLATFCIKDLFGISSYRTITAVPTN